MSNELSLYKDGKYVTGFGLAHNFEVDGVRDFDYDYIKKEFSEFKGRMLSDMVKNVAYSPKSKEEMDEMVEEFLDNMEYFTDEMMKFGTMFLISYALEDEGVEVKDDYEEIDDKIPLKEEEDDESIKDRKALEEWRGNGMDESDGVKEEHKGFTDEMVSFWKHEGVEVFGNDWDKTGG